MDNDEDDYEVSITRGDSAVFICKFIERENELQLQWRVGNFVYECNETEFYGCSTSDSYSLFQLKNTTHLHTGNYSVQCILWQNISEEFQNDPSFDERSYNLSSMIGMLKIIEPSAG